MKPLSLSTRLTLYYSLLLALLLIGFGLLSYRLLALQVDRTLNEELNTYAAGLRGYLRFGGGRLDLVFDENDPEQAYFIHNATRYYQVLDPTDGSLIVQSRDLDLMGVRPSPARVRDLVARPRVTDEETPRGDFRFHNSVFQAGEQTLLIRVGISLRPRTALLEGFFGALGLLLPVGVLLAAVGGWRMARHALGPMSDLAAAARRIDVERLSERLPVRGTGDEMDRLARAFNDTLTRLDHAVAQMKQFTANVSHELRTPLTALRGEAEVVLLELRSIEDYRRVLGSQLEEFDKLTRLVNQLLTLARAEAGDVSLARRPVDLSALAHSLGEQMEPIASAKEIRLDLAPGDGISVRADPDWLERAILNLLDNAIKFTPPGASVRLSVVSRDGEAFLRVEDSGPGIQPDVLPHIFDRFYHTDPSPSAGRAGAGLGLALVKWIVDQHGGRIEVAARPGGGSSFTVRLPLDSSGAAAPFPSAP